MQPGFRQQPVSRAPCPRCSRCSSASGRIKACVSVWRPSRPWATRARGASQPQEPGTYPVGGSRERSARFFLYTLASFWLVLSKNSVSVNILGIGYRPHSLVIGYLQSACLSNIHTFSSSNLPGAPYFSHPLGKLSLVGLLCSPPTTTPLHGPAPIYLASFCPLSKSKDGE